MSPYIIVQPGETVGLADITGAGAIQQIWMTLARGKWRHTILRAYWDDQEQPSVECPAGDFFANGWESYAQVTSLPVCVNPGRGFNCYWEMPFCKRTRWTLSNLSAEETYVYYQINYTLTDVPEDVAYFHAQFRRTNPLPFKTDYTILDGVTGQGHFVGTYMAWGVNNAGWWGEGEIKSFYGWAMGSSPPSAALARRTISAAPITSTPAPWSHVRTLTSPPIPSSTPLTPVCPRSCVPTAFYRSQQRFGMYRWHIMDPIRFEADLRVTIQAIGWHTDKDRRYLPLQDDIASAAWLVSDPAGRRCSRALPDKDYLEVI